jgi:Protein of unknown function (DUF3102)
VNNKHLAALAEKVRNADMRVRLSMSHALDAALDAGDALIAARLLVAHGGWADWLGKHCDVSMRMANNYIRLAENRALIDADRKRVSEMSIRAALKLLTPKRSEQRVRRTKSPVPAKLTTVLKLALSANQPGEAMAALAAIKRMLKTLGRSLHDIELVFSTRSASKNVRAA